MLWGKYGSNTEEMESNQLKAMFKDKMGLSEDVLSSIINVFGDGNINRAQFEMSLALLTKQCNTTEEQSTLRSNSNFGWLCVS